MAAVLDPIRKARILQKGKPIVLKDKSFPQEPECKAKVRSGPVTHKISRIVFE